MKLSNKIIPPGDPVTTWRWCIAVLVAILLVNALFGRGVLGGILEYAYASDLAEQTQKIDRVLKLQIAETLRGLKKDKCTTNGDRYALDKAIEQYQLEYSKLHGSRYPLTECDP